MRKRNPLKGRMYEYGVTQQELANYLGMSLSYTASRVNGSKPWTVSELARIGKLLEIDRQELMNYVI